jgi:c-di-GMP-binding flagellar brake protein YcgR
MRPRRILTGEETALILDEAVRQSALAVLTVHEDSRWHMFKSRFLERDARRRFIVLDYQETHGTEPTPLVCGQYVGVSFRYKSRKVMFATVVEARGRYLVDPKTSVPAVRYRWPESLTELQRRAYFRTPIPAEVRVVASLWPGGLAARERTQTTALSVATGEALDLSCGGTLVRLNQIEAPQWTDNQTLGVSLHLPDGQPPLLVDAYYRGTRHDAGSHLCAAVQFVGLELSPGGRGVLQRLARCVQNSWGWNFRPAGGACCSGWRAACRSSTARDWSTTCGTGGRDFGAGKLGQQGARAAASARWNLPGDGRCFFCAESRADRAGRLKNRRELAGRAGSDH